MRYIKIIILLLISNSLFGQKIVTSGGWITSNFQYLNDTLLLTQNRLKIKSNNGDNKIIIDNRKPFSYSSGTVTASDKIMEIFPPVNRNVATADTTPSFYIWNDYTKYQTGQTGDNVIGFGMNLSNGNVRAVSNFPAVGISMENWYQPNLGGNGLTEFLTHWIPKSGGIKRPFAWYGDNTANTLNMQFQPDIFSIVNNTTGVEVFNNTGGTFIYKGNTSTGSGARPEIRLADQRNVLKYSGFSADTAGMGVSGYKFLSFALSDNTGWISILNRVADTKLLFGRTTPNVNGRPFFETQDDGQGFYKSGGTILLGGYSTMGSPANGGYGGVGSNYYLDNSGVLKRASADVSNGIYFENNTWKFWTSVTGSANGSITMTNKATMNASGFLALGTTSSPSEALDVTGNVKFSGALMPNNTAGTSGQVLTSAGAGVVPTWQTNTSESTTIGAFQSSGNSNGLTLSGTDIRLHAATISTPGAVNVGQQTFGVSSGTKLFNGTGSYQIDVDGDTDNTPAGITFTQLGGADQLGFMYMNSADANNASFRLGLEEDGALTDQLNIGTLNDTRGMYSRNGLYEDVTAVTTSPYTVLYGDRNIYLDGTSITVNLQAIGGSTGETKVGRVIYFFNDNATNVTITPNGSETINDSASLTLLPNTGVTLLAVTGTKWVTRD